MAGEAAPQSERYTIISADTHAGGSHAQYREYLEADLLEEFDAWRSRYENPFKDLRDDRRERNWDSERRWSEMEADGITAEIIFPNTVPPFFPSFVLFARPPKPADYRHRLAGMRAHNRWLADFVAECPNRRAGIGQIFLNDLDDAIADVRWIKEHGLRGGVLLPATPPDADYVSPLYDPVFDPVWRECEELGVPVNTHGGSGSPLYGKYPVADLLYLDEVVFYSQRPFAHMLLSGVFERFPGLKFVMTEMGCAWLPPMLERMDKMIARIRNTGTHGELRFGDDHVLPKSATEYFRQNCHVGISQPKPPDAQARALLGPEYFMWGSDYPHDEGTYPYTREHLRQIFSGLDRAGMVDLLGGNAARLYGFDLESLAPDAARVGPTVSELAEPLEDLPENPNEALLRGAGLI